MKITKEQVLNSYRVKRFIRWIEDSKGVQAAKILELLLDNFWKKVPLTRISKAWWKQIYQYWTRIHELRALWLIIENEIEHFNTTEVVFWREIECKNKKSTFKLIWIK